MGVLPSYSEAKGWATRQAAQEIKMKIPDQVTPIKQDKEVISQWSESAPYWEKHREIIREMFAPITQALIEAAEITTSQVVLDVATGPGEPALSIAGLVGPEGKVFGVDAAPEDGDRRER